MVMEGRNSRSIGFAFIVIFFLLTSLLLHHKTNANANLLINEQVKASRSFLEKIPNKHVSNFIWAFRNVSYSKGVLYVHNPSKEDYDHLTDKSQPGYLPLTEAYFPFRSIQIVNTPFDIRKCQTYQTSHVTFARFTDPKNCYACNQGHLIMNIINPLFFYFFHVYFKIDTLDTNASLLPKHLSALLPLRDTILVYEGYPSAPVYLFDFVLRFSSRSVNSNTFFSSISQHTHCFAAVDMPVLPRGAYWDRMYHTLGDRWGVGNFYKHFWVTIKDTILRTYHVNQKDGGKVAQFSAQTNTNNSISISTTNVISVKAKRKFDLFQKHNDANTKPSLIWSLRSAPSGQLNNMARTRVDLNTHLIQNAFSQYFNFKFLNNNDFAWHTSSGSRMNSTKHTLSKIWKSDVLVGQHGANLWNALFLEENAMFVELHGYMGFNNLENGPTLASHNNLAYYMSDIRKYEVSGVGMQYTEVYLNSLAKEVYDSWLIEESFKKLPLRSKDVSGKCTFKLADGNHVLSSTEVSRCYLTQVKKGKWMQLKQRLLCYYEPCDGKANTNQFKNDLKFCGDLC